MYKTTRGIVLREVKYKEADKILTILTEDEGKMTVKARGALRKGCKYAAATQMLTYSEMTLFGSKGRWSMNEAVTLEQFLDLRMDIEKLALGTYFAEAMESVTDEDFPNPEVLHLGLNSLFALSRDLYTPEHIKSVFEFRLMCLSGFEPDLSGCVRCGKSDPEDAYLALNGGVMHCRGCAPGSSGVSLPLTRGAVDAMRYISSAEPKRVFSFSVSDVDEGCLSGVAEAYMEAQLERGFRALDYWKSVKFKPLIDKNGE